MRRGSVASTTRWPVIGTGDAKVKAVLTLLLRILVARPATDAAAMAQVARLGDALKFLGPFRY